MIGAGLGVRLERPRQPVRRRRRAERPLGHRDRLGGGAAVAARRRADVRDERAAAPAGDPRRAGRLRRADASCPVGARAARRRTRASSTRRSRACRCSAACSCCSRGATVIARSPALLALRRRRAISAEQARERQPDEPVGVKRAASRSSTLSERGGRVSVTTTTSPRAQRPRRARSLRARAGPSRAPACRRRCAPSSSWPKDGLRGSR